MYTAMAPCWFNVFAMAFELSFLTAENGKGSFASLPAALDWTFSRQSRLHQLAFHRQYYRRFVQVRNNLNKPH